MGQHSSTDDSARLFEPGGRRVDGAVPWADPADRTVLGTGDRWVGRYFPLVDMPDPGYAVEAPFLADGYAEDWERLERYAVRQRFRAGDEIVRHGQFERSLIIVLSGQLSLIVVNHAGDECVLDIVGARSLVGEIGFFDPDALPVAVRARGDGELLRLSFSRFEALAASCPLLGRTILLEAGRVMAMGRRRRAVAMTLATAEAVASGDAVWMAR
jgi:CRP-like cAMP-binding protein